MEKWKDIECYEGKYQISTYGRVKSLTRDAFNGKVTHTLQGRFLKIQSNGNYNKVSLSMEGKVRQFLVHRLVAKAFIFNMDNKPEVNHINKNCFDNTLDNLEWVTAKENCKHKLLYKSVP